jgi:hypothetical protein
VLLPMRVLPLVHALPRLLLQHRRRPPLLRLLQLLRRAARLSVPSLCTLKR